MKLKFMTVALVLVLGLVPILNAQAQGGGNYSGSISSNGGGFGSPGMSGATANTTTTRNSQSFSGFNYAGSSGTLGNGGTANGSRPSGGNFGNGSRGEGTSFSFGGSTDASPFSSFFGEAGSFSQFQISRDGLSWEEFGGFGSQTNPETSVPMGTPDNISRADWQPPSTDELPVTGAPSILEDNQDLISAQIQTWQDSGQQAQDNAQQTYDQFWSDYYDAVDYAAQAYYNSVSSSVDYAYNAYISAVDYTTAQVDYYIDYAVEYAEWCYYYPWECYSYVYDETSNTYINIEYVSDQPTATVTLEEFLVNWSAIPVEPNSSAEAYSALVVFANDQLGITVQPLYAGDATPQIQSSLQYLPPEAEAYAALLSSMDGAYWGIFNGGVGVVGSFDCNAGCSLETIPAEFSDASSGVYMLNISAPMVNDDASALDLITTVYPKFNGLEFATIAEIESGYAYMATAFGVGIDDTGQSVTVPKLIVTGVTQVEGTTVVYSMVAVGQMHIDAYYNLMH